MSVVWRDMTVTSGGLIVEASRGDAGRTSLASTDVGAGEHPASVPDGGASLTSGDAVIPASTSCSWCDLPHVTYVTIPGEPALAACSGHALNLADAAFLRAVEVGLV